MTENEMPVGMKTDLSNPKIPYSRPQLVVYGDIREITLTKQTSKRSDNPGQENNMTGFK